MHKPKRKSKYWEQFSYEYDGVTYSGKKNCCEKLGLRYLGVLQHAHDYNCTFEEAISQCFLCITGYSGKDKPCVTGCYAVAPHFVGSTIRVRIF